MLVLVVGASGRIGSEAVASSLAKGYDTVAFLRTPAKLSQQLKDHATLKIVKGDAENAADIGRAIGNDGHPVNAVIVAAPMGDMFKRDMLNVVNAVKQNQQSDIKVWIMAGGAVQSIPQKSADQPANAFFPITFYPQYMPTVEFLRKEAQDVDWTMLCPALIKDGPRRGPLTAPSEHVPNYKPSWISSIPVIGIFVELMITWTRSTVTYKGLADIMVENLECDGKLKGKRVTVLEEAA